MSFEEAIIQLEEIRGSFMSVNLPTNEALDVAVDNLKAVLVLIKCTKNLFASEAHGAALNRIALSLGLAVSEDEEETRQRINAYYSSIPADERRDGE